MSEATHRAVYQANILIWVWKHISADSVRQRLYMLRSKQKHLSGGALSHVVGRCARANSQRMAAALRPAREQRLTLALLHGVYCAV